eukprot:TRINITY_DN131_c1_g1_i12.p1 TRINITY_DN131_c1_g1~~TRINITY_DN131_c1_g1_i12.p1  ORF type:complete len:119 (+),score=37.42 TRINITY_DN131_c1_g1_i12:39-359(+)
MPNLLQMAGLKPDYSPSSLPKTTIEHKPPTQQQQLTANTNLSPQKISSPQQQQQLTATTNISSPKIIPPQQQQQQQHTTTTSSTWSITNCPKRLQPFFCTQDYYRA